MTNENQTASPWVVRFAPLVPIGAAVLDVAAGAGRHSKLFLDRGHKVTALDRDVSQLSELPGLRVIQADLENGSPWPLPGESFGAVIVTNYLWRPVFPSLIGALESGGFLIYETFAQGHQAYGRPCRDDFLLGRGELLERCAGLTILAYEDGVMGGTRVAQRICACKGEGPFAVP